MPVKGHVIFSAEKENRFQRHTFPANHIHRHYILMLPARVKQHLFFLQAIKEKNDG